MIKNNYKISAILIMLILLTSIPGVFQANNLDFTRSSLDSSNGNSRSINLNYWGNEVNLSAIDDNGSINPEIAVYKNNIHVIWEENYNIYYRRSVDYGINWSDIKVIASNKKYNATSPTMTIEGYNIYVAWVNVTFTYEDSMGAIEDIDGEIYYRYSLDNGLSWSNDIEIISNHTHFPRIAVENNKIHMVWSKNDYYLWPDLYTLFSFEVYYMNFTTSSSGTPIFLSSSITSLFEGQLPGLDIAVEKNNVHVVWKDYKSHNGSIRYLNSFDNGTTWSQIKNITYEYYKSFKFTSIEADEDNVYVSFIECIGYDRAEGFINSSDNGVTWSNYMIFDKNAEWYDGPDLTAVDGKVFLVWANNSQNQIYLKTSFDYCQNWSENIKITNSINGSSTPKIGVGDNYTHIVMLRDPWPREIFYQNNYPIYEIKLIPILDNRTAVEDLFYEQKYSSIGALESLVNWTYQSNATWLNWNTSNHTLYGTPTNDDVGQYWVRINISFNNELFDEHNFTLTVQNVNDPPEIIGAPTELEVKAYEDYELDMSNFIFDVDNNSNELSLIDNSNYSVIQQKSIIFNYTNSVAFEEVKIKAWDGIDYSKDHIINLTVIPKNETLPSVLDTHPLPFNTGVALDITISITFNKPMNITSVEDAFSIRPETPGTFIWSSNNITMMFAPDSILYRNFQYEVTVSGFAKDIMDNTLDGNLNGSAEGSPIDDYSWIFETVGPPNFIPDVKIDSPLNNSVHYINDTIYFDCINTTDPDGDFLKFLWISNISGILGGKPQFTASLPVGYHQITLYVNDGHGHNVSESIIVIVTPWNRPPLPIISSPYDNQKFNVTDIIHFDASNSTDPDNDYLFFSWHSNISGNLGQISKFSITLPIGHHVITLFVNDGHYHTLNRSINIYVVNGSGPSTNGNGHPLKPPGTESDSGTLGRVAIYSGIIAIIIIVILTAFVTTTEVGKYGFLGYVIPLYSRLKGKKVLDHETRGMIRGYIIANPGDHYNSIKRNLGLKNGSLTYHLKVLEREEIVKSERDGIFKRFYPKDERIPADIMHVTKIQESILNDIIDNPGITQKGLATNIGVSHQVVNYHVKKLVSANMVKAERLGKTTKYYPIED